MPRPHPSVSICIPTYNGSVHLRACMDSVLAQTTADVEIIAVDDGSSDDTPAILAEYARRDTRVQLHHNTRNLGLVGNWNRCLNLAGGEWIKFVFQDDTVRPDAVQRLLDVAHECGAPLAFGRRDFLFEEGVPDSARAWYQAGADTASLLFPSTGCTSAQRFAELVLERPSENFVGEPVSVLFRRDLPNKVGPFNRHLAVFCDMEFWMRAGVNFGVGSCNDVVASFRVHAGSTTAMNVRSRRFRMDVLDHVITAHEFAFHPAFGPLRQAAAAGGIDLRRRFAEMSRWAHATVTARGGDYAGTSAARDWSEAATAYPRLRAAGRGRQAAALGQRVVRRARSLARQFQIRG